MINSLIFLGQFDDEQISLENDVINMEENTENKTIVSTFKPDVIYFPIKGSNYKAWVLVGNVEPEKQLQILIRKVKLIIFTFNLTKPETLTFLKEGWGQIIQKVDANKPDQQKRFLVGTFPKLLKPPQFDIEQIYSKLTDIMNYFSCTHYFEYGTIPKFKAKCPIEISTNLISFIQHQILINEEVKYEVLDNSIVFIGEFDDDQISFANDVINMEKNSKNLIIDSSSERGIKNFPIEGYESEAYVFIGNNEPTKRFQNLLNKMKIIIFTFNLKNLETLTYLEDKWLPIIETLNEPSQERILVGIYSKSTETTDYNLQVIYDRVKLLKDTLKFTKYFEYGEKPKTLKCPKSIEITKNVIKYIQDQLPLQYENEEEEEEESKKDDKKSKIRNQVLGEENTTFQNDSTKDDDFKNDDQDDKEEDIYEVTDNSIVFVGQFDDEQISFENDVINMENNTDNILIDSSSKRGIKNFPIEGYESEAYVFIGNNEPTKRFQNLLNKMKIIIFTFNLTDSNTLTYLENKWLPIIETSEEQSQERILVGIHPKSSKKADYKLKTIYDKVNSLKKKLNFTKYFEYGKKPKTLTRPSSCKIKISTEIFTYINDQLPKDPFNVKVLDNSIVFAGQFDNEQISFENDVINMEINSKKLTIDSKSEPGIKKFPIEGYESEAYVFIGNIKPTKLFQNLLNKMKIIIFTFNLTNSKTLTYLEDKWLPIIETLKEPSQERILVGIHPKSSKKSDYKLKTIYDKVKPLKKSLNISKYFEYGKSPNGLTRPSSCKITVSKNIFTYIQDQLPNNQIEEEESDEEPSDERKEQIEKLTNDSKNKEDENKNAQINIKASERKQCDNKNIEDKQIIEANTIEINNINYKLSTKNKFAEIIQSQDAKGEVYIPEFVEHESKEYKIIGIKTNSFSNTSIETFKMINDENITISQNSFEKCRQLKSIIIQTKETVHIEENNFNDIPSLETIHIKAKQIIIDNNCFNECFTRQKYGHSSRFQKQIINMEGTNKISIGNKCFQTVDFLVSVEFKGYRISIGEDCFDKSDYLSSFKISECNDFSLGRNQFYKCLQLQNLELKSSKIELGIRCFSFSSLTKVEISGEEIKLCKNCFSDLLSLSYFSIKKSNIIIANESAFAGCNNLENVSFISSQTLNIGNSSFINLKSLKTIIIDCPEVSIGESSFMNCESLSTIIFDKVIELEISKQAFSQCESLKELPINAFSKIKLGQNCFYNCKNLTSINLSSEEVLIEESCFENCSSLLSLVFSEVNVLDIGLNSIKNCENLEQITIQKSGLVHFGKSSFFKDSKLSLIKINAKELIIDENCFCQCNSLRFLNFDKVLNSVFNTNSFKECNNLVNISIKNSNSVNFGENIFDGNKNISSIEIQSDEIKFSNKFINFCPCLKKIVLNSIENIEITENTFLGCSSLSTIEINSGKLIDFKDKCFTKSENLERITIRSNEIIINKDSFSFSTKLKSITIECSQLTIGEDAFKNCINIPTISFRDLQYAAIGVHAFSGCSSLSKIEINSQNSINILDECFAKSGNLTEITLKSNQVNIDKDCFSISPKLKYIAIECSDLTIGENAFMKCSNLTSIVFNNLQTAVIGSHAFSGFSKLKTIIFKAKTKISLGDSCFYGALFLGCVTFESEEVLIFHECFKGCKNLQSLAFKNVQNTFIDSNSFINCSKLINIDISSPSRINLSNNCFSGVENLDSIILRSKEITIGKYCFNKCKHLSNIQLFDAENSTIETDAFYGCENLYDIKIVVKSNLKICNYCFYGMLNLRTVYLSGGYLTIGDSIFKDCPYIISATLKSSTGSEVNKGAFKNSPKLIKIDTSNLK